MAKVVGDIAVQVGADVSGLESGMKRAGRSVEDFESRAAKMGANFAKVAVGVGVAVAAIGAAGLRMAQSAGAAATEIDNLSRVAGVGAEQFQMYAAGAAKVGIEQEKLADIFKDVNDKFGDFMANGAGPLADFFDNIAPKVGVTAEQFAKLSGPEALQLYVTSLERAGLSQQQMTFYMEALASDATALLPLLERNGAAMRMYGDAAAAAGRIMSDEMVQSGVEMDRKLREITDTIQMQAKIAVIEYSDEIIAAAEFVSGTLLPAVANLGAQMAAFAEDMQPAIDALGRFISLAQAAAGVGVDGTSAVPNDEYQAQIDADVARRPGEGDPSNSGLYYVDENGNVGDYGSAPSIPGITVQRANNVVPSVYSGGGSSGSGRSSSGGGGSRSASSADTGLERLIEDLKTEAEILEEWRAESMERLAEANEAELEVLGGHAEAKLRLEEEYQERLARIKELGEQSTLALALRGGEEVLAAMGAFNEKALKISQVFAEARAFIAMQQGAAEELKAGTLGFPKAAAVIAQGLKFIAAIQSVSASAPSSSSSSRGAGASQSAPTPSTVYNISLVGEGNIPKSAVRGLITQINEEIENGAVIRGITLN